MAAITVAQLKAVLSADITIFTSELKKAQANLASFASEAASIGSKLTMGLTLPIVGFGVAAVKTATTMDSLMRGLTAVAGSADEANKQFTELREVAKLPGLGLEEAVQGSINLQAAGFSAAQAEGALKAFGNALATVGKGKADLDGVTLALSQIASKGKISAEEINQLAERVPQIRKAMKDAFGTANTDQLQKQGLGVKTFVEGVTRELSKLPSVTGGAQNAFENLQDTIKISLNEVGKNILPTLIPMIEKLTNWIVKLTDSFSKLPDHTREAIIQMLAAAAAIGPLIFLAGKLATAVAFLATPFGIAVAAVVALGVAWNTNFLGIQDVTIDVINTITFTVQEWLAGMGQMWDGFLTGASGKWAEGWEKIKAGSLKVWDGLAKGAQRAGEERAKIDEGGRIRELAANKAHATAIKNVQTGLTDDVTKIKTDGEKEMEHLLKLEEGLHRQLAAARGKEGDELQGLLAQFPLISAARLRHTALMQQQLAHENALIAAHKRFKEGVLSTDAAIRAAKGTAGVPTVEQLMLEEKLSEAEAKRRRDQLLSLKQTQDVTSVLRELNQANRDQLDSTARGAIAWKMFGSTLGAALQDGQKEVVTFEELIQHLSSDQLAQLNLAVRNHGINALNDLRTATLGLLTQTGLLKTRVPEVRVAFQNFGQELRMLKPEFQDLDSIADTLAERWGVAAVEVKKALKDMTKAEREAMKDQALLGIAKQLEDVFRTALGNIDHGLKGLFSSLVSGFRNMLKQLAAEFLASEAIRMIVGAFHGDTSGFSSTLSKAFLGRASGGHVNAGQMYMVGEEGPELFMAPAGGGTIVPNYKMAGQTIQHFHYHITALDAPGVRKAQGQLAADASRQARAFERRNG